MKKLVITGNAGMIGTVLTHYFLTKNYSIVGIDNLSGGFLANVPAGIKFYPIDICDSKSINSTFEIEKPSFVIHCAAYAAEALSPFIRNFNYTNNVVGSMNIINACINYDVEKMINFSSMATYGETAVPFKEDCIRNPIDCYGIAKLAVEMDLKEAYEHFGLKSTSILPHNVISKYQNYYDRYRNVIAIWIRQCLANENITIFGDGLQKRSFSDCKFLCKPIEKLLYGYENEIFNLGSDNEITIKEAAEIVLSVGNQFGSTSKIVHLEPRNEVKLAFSDHTKAKTLLNFEDNTNLLEVVKEMFLYAKEMPKTKVEYMKYEIERNMYSFWKKT